MNQSLRYFSQPMTLNTFVTWSSSAKAPFGLETNWNTHLGGGDSSSPEVFLVGNQFVLVSHNYSEDTNSWTGTGPNYAYQFNAINEKIHYLSVTNNVGTDYQLTPFYLTNWPPINH